MTPLDACWRAHAFRAASLLRHGFVLQLRLRSLDAGAWHGSSVVGLDVHRPVRKTRLSQRGRACAPRRRRCAESGGGYSFRDAALTLPHSRPACLPQPAARTTVRLAAYLLAKCARVTHCVRTVTPVCCRRLPWKLRCRRSVCAVHPCPTSFASCPATSNRCPTARSMRTSCGAALARSRACCGKPGLPKPSCSGCVAPTLPNLRRAPQACLTRLAVSHAGCASAASVGPVRQRRGDARRAGGARCFRKAGPCCSARLFLS
jgi:hypothetical protein